MGRRFVGMGERVEDCIESLAICPEVLESVVPADTPSTKSLLGFSGGLETEPPAPRGEIALELSSPDCYGDGLNSERDDPAPSCPTAPRGDDGFKP